METISQIKGIPRCDICRTIIGTRWVEVVVDYKKGYSWFICQECVGTFAYDGKDPIACQMGKRGGEKGGYARAKSLSPERRSEIASLAAKKRWSK